MGAPLIKQGNRSVSEEVSAEEKFLLERSPKVRNPMASPVGQKIMKQRAETSESKDFRIGAHSLQGACGTNAFPMASRCLVSAPSKQFSLWRLGSG